jgi:hypothetical protein
MDAENYASIGIEDEYSDTESKSHNKTLNGAINEDDSEDNARRRSSVVHAIKLLPQDEMKKVGSMGLVFLRAKKLINTEWKESGIVQKILFVIEAPIKFLV